jgi:hypothetical protein
MHAMLLPEMDEIGTEVFRHLTSRHLTLRCDPSRLSSEHFFGRLMGEDNSETNN